jgi:hypothetical protein
VGKTAEEREIMDKTDMENKKTVDETFDLKIIMKVIMSSGDKDSKAYKVTEYYNALMDGKLDDGRVALIRSKILSIEKELRKWAKEYPNNGRTIRLPEDGALILIDDLRNRGFL